MSKSTLKQEVKIIIRNEEDLKEHFHSIHDYIRNKFGFYGKSALQFFNLLFVLKLIEPIIKKLTDSELSECKYSDLVDCVDGSDRAYKLKQIRKIIFSEKSILKDTIFMNGSFEDFNENQDHLKGLLNKIDVLTPEIMDKYHVQGRVYEYFLGFVTQKNKGKKTGSQIEDLGQYYTSKKITRYCMAKVNPSLNKDGNIHTMGDFFCGSGGFITEYIHFLNDKYKQKINWIDNIFNLYGCDTDRDIIKSAIVDILLLTDTFSPLLNKAITEKKDFSIKANIKRIGSTFEDVFSEDSDIKVKYNFTNPPYGGSGKGENDKLLLKHATKSIQHIAMTGSVNLDKPPKGFKPTKSKMNLINGDNKETLSLLHGMSILDKDGFYCGVLKEGVFFDGKFKDLRKNLIENYDVKYVISVPQSDFWNTSTKTSILIFKNSGKQTTEVKFCELKETDDFDIINEVNPETNKPISTFNSSNYKMDLVKDGEYLSVSFEDLKEQAYSLNFKNYIKQDIQVNEGFKVVKLGDICDIVDGFAFKTENFKNSGIPIIQISNINNNLINELNSDKFIEHNILYNKYIVNKGDIVLGMTGNIQEKIAIYYDDKIKYLNQRVCKFTNFENEYIKIYVYYYWIHKEIGKYIQFKANGSIQQNISKEDLKNLEIPIPNDISTVKLYLDYLNPANESLQSLQSLQSQKERAICGLIKMLTSFGKDGVEWDEYRLGDICTLNPKNEKINFEYIEYLDITNCLEFKTIKLKNDENLTSSAKKTPKIGDILISSVRPNNKNITLIRKNNYIDNLVVSRGFISLRILSHLKINPEYILYYLLRDDITNYFMSKTIGSGYPELNTLILNNLRIRILKPHIIAKYKLEEDYDFMDKLKNDISQTLKNQEDITKQMMKLVLSPDKTEEIKKTLETVESDNLDELEKLEKELEQDEVKPKRTKGIVKVC
jgi:type I restriction enzyme S subunit